MVRIRNMKHARAVAIALTAVFLMLLPAIHSGLGSHITLATFQSITQPVGIAFNPTSGNLIVSSGWPSGASLLSVSPITGAVSTFRSGTFGPFEVKIAVSQGACAFTAGDVFVGNAYGLGTIGIFDSSGSTVVGSITLPAPDDNPTGLHYEDMGLACDTVGTQFGGDLIAVTNDGRVYRINTSLTTPTLVRDFDEFLEGVTVAPLGFGPVGGQVIIGKEFAGTVVAVDNTGAFTTVMSGLQAGSGTGVEDVKFVPSIAQNYYVDYFQANSIVRAPAGEFVGFEGDLVVASEFPGRVDIIRFDTSSSSFVLADTTDSFRQFEQTTFGLPNAAGCTPGFWKNHAFQPPWPAAYSPSTTVVSVFSAAAPYVFTSTDTLVTALGYPGGSTTADAARILLRAGTAALLNAATLGGNYPLATSQVISMVNTALGSADRNTMLALATQLDGFNNLGCPLSVSGGGHALAL